MTKLSRFFVLSLLLSSAGAVASPEAPDFLGVSPAFYDFGPVAAGESRSMVVFFQNFSNETIPFFNAYCSGDLSAFDCFSSCFTLLPFGSCSVRVQFSPRNGDGSLRSVQVHGYGGRWFRTSHIQGVDRKE